MPKDKDADRKYRDPKRDSRDHDEESVDIDKRDSREDRHNKDRKKRRHERSSRRERKHHDDDSAVSEDDRRRHKKPRHKSSKKIEDNDSTSSRSDARHRKKDSRRNKKDGSRKKKNRKDEDRETKKSKSKRKHTRHEQRSSDDDEKRQKKSKKSRSRDKPLNPDKSALFPLGDPVGSPPTTLIDPEKDYFTYHQEFWVYLFREEGTRFNDLKSDEAREAFKRFSKIYNGGKLEAAYYTNPPTFPPQVLEESKTTQHTWGFQTTATERRGLEQLQEGVRRLTQYKNDEGTASNIAPAVAGKSNGDSEARFNSNSERKHQMTPEERMDERRANRRLKEHVKTAQEEITGGAKDLRERQLEKKREHAARIHGAARDREEGGAGIELDDAAVYGNGDRSFQQALARERQSKAKREEKRNARVEELKTKEQERQANILKMLGLDGLQPGKKIQIAPRKDG